MSEGALWLNYCLSAAFAFVAVYLGHWRIPKATMGAAAATLLVWLLFSLFRGGTLDDPWLGVALFINAIFCLIFGAIGAFFGFLTPVRQKDDD